MGELSAKEIVLSFVKNLPENISFQEIVYQLYVKEKILQGLKDADNGRVISNDEMKEIINSWEK